MTLPGGGYQGSAIGYADVSAAGGFIPELWSTEIKRRRDAVLLAKSICTVNTTMANKGDVLHYPEIGRLAVNDKVLNTPVTLQSRQESEWTLIVDKHKEASFMIEDIVRIQGSMDLRKPYIQEAGYALAKDCDNFILGLRADIQGYNSQSNVIYATSDATSTGTPQSISRAEILAAKEILMEADVPEEDLFLVVAPSTYVDLLTIEQFVSFDYVQDRPTVTGQVGSLYGMKVYVSTQITVTSDSAAYNGDPGSATAMPAPGVTGSPWYPTQTVVHFGDTITASTLTTTGSMYVGIMGHKDWARLAISQAPKVESARETRFLADVVVNSHVFGAKTYRPDHAVLIYSL